jgi:hypothetical protein
MDTGLLVRFFFIAAKSRAITKEISRVINRELLPFAHGQEL